MKFDFSELQTWLQLIGVTSFVALITTAIKVWRWLTNPLRKAIVQLSQKQQGTKAELEKQAFEIRTKLTEDLRKFMDIEHRLDSLSDNIKDIETSRIEVANNLVDNMIEIKKDFDIIKHDVNSLRLDLSSRLSSIEGELVYIRTAIINAMKKG